MHNMCICTIYKSFFVYLAPNTIKNSLPTVQLACYHPEKKGLTADNLQLQGEDQSLGLSTDPSLGQWGVENYTKALFAQDNQRNL